MKVRSIAFCVLLMATACGSSPSNNKLEPAPQPSYKPMDGYRDLKLGMSFEDAIGRLDSDLFNPVSLKECFDDLAIRGCGLSPKSDDTIYEMRSGIRYALKLEFNSDDKLTDIELNYHREGGITGSQCRSIFARTVDWASKDYGPLSYQRTGDRPIAKAPEGNVFATTPGGTKYLYNKPDESGSFVVSFLHPVGEKLIQKTENGKKLTFIDQQSISLFASYIVVGRDICDIDFSIREPDSVPRPAFLSEPQL